MIAPRQAPSRDEKYMGLAWFISGFSKDPSTQVGAQIVSADNLPLGSGYNGPPAPIDDHAFSWERPPADDPQAFSKYDVIFHAERNAVKHSFGRCLRGATLYVTALPCPDCMLEIVDQEISRVVYYDYQSTASSSLQNAAWRQKSFRIAGLSTAGLRLEKFSGDLHWVNAWNARLIDIGVLGSCPTT